MTDHQRPASHYIGKAKSLFNRPDVTAKNFSPARDLPPMTSDAADPTASEALRRCAIVKQRIRIATHRLADQFSDIDKSAARRASREVETAIRQYILAKRWADRALAVHHNATHVQTEHVYAEWSITDSAAADTAACAALSQLSA